MTSGNCRGRPLRRRRVEGTGKRRSRSRWICSATGAASSMQRRHGRTCRRRQRLADQLDGAADPGAREASSAGAPTEVGHDL